jgi:predicted Zn-dependent protease
MTFELAIRLSPHDPFKTIRDTNLGDIEIGAGRPEAAIVECRKSLDAGDHTYWVYANLAASYALLGKMDEAKPFVAETLRLNPSFTIKWYREHVGIVKANVYRPFSGSKLAARGDNS